MGRTPSGVPDMKNLPQFEPVAWSWARNQIGRDLRNLYEVPKELPPKMVWLATKLDDDRDWLFASDSWENDTDLLGGRVQG